MGLVTESNRKWWTLFAVTFSLFMIMLDNTVVNVALPAIEDDLGLGLSGLQWVVNAYVLSFAVLLLSGGKLADYLGRRRIFLAGLVVFTLASLGCGLADGGGMLIAARAVQGVGAAFMLPSTLSIISASFEPHERGKAIGIWAGASGMALAIGPFIGGILIEAISWRWIFFVNIPIGVIGVIATVLVVRESRDNSADQSLDLGGLVLSGAGLVALTYGLVEGNERGWSSAFIVLCFVAAAVLLAAFVVLEARGRAPMLDFAYFRNRTFAGANAVGLLLMLVMFGVFFFVSIYLQEVRDYSALRTGLTFLPMTFLIAFVSPVAGSITDRIGARWPMTAGLVLVTISLLLLARLDETSSLWTIVPSLAIGGLGFGGAMVPMTAAVLGSAPIDKAGVSSGVLTAARHVGGALGIAIMGAILAGQVGDLEAGDAGFDALYVSGLEEALLLGAVVAAVGAVISAVTIGTHRQLDAYEPAEAGA